MRLANAASSSTSRRVEDAEEVGVIIYETYYGINSKNLQALSNKTFKDLSMSALNLPDARGNLYKGIVARAGQEESLVRYDVFRKVGAAKANILMNQTEQRPNQSNECFCRAITEMPVKSDQQLIARLRNCKLLMGDILGHNAPEPS